MMASKPLGNFNQGPIRDQRERLGEYGRFGGKFQPRMAMESQEAATLTPEQKAEIERRVEAHAERVQRKMEQLGLVCAATRSAEIPIATPLPANGQ